MRSRSAPRLAIAAFAALPLVGWAAEPSQGEPVRRVLGGVYPVSNDGSEPDGVEVPGYPMPFADVDDGSGVVYTDAGGNVTGVAGTIATELDGLFLGIADGCGPVLESSAGDLDLGEGDGTDCAVPPDHSAGDTHAARTAFYELNRIQQMARGQLPRNGWLGAQLTANLNVRGVCGAFWNGSEVTYFRSSEVCSNPGELAGVLDHEWGHGLDDNDANGAVSFPAEGIADLYAALRLDRSCVGRGFFANGMLCGGYGDPCTPASGCTGVRDIDWANHASGQPHGVDWALANCNDTPHCLGLLNAEAVWDLATRDLPGRYGFDANTALEIATRLTYLGAGGVGTWFTTAGGCQDAMGCGCAGSSGYLQFLQADDDDGNLANGTPHMQAVFAAFDRHDIACDVPPPLDSGCPDRPKAAPEVSGSGGDRSADLSWTPIEGAVRYRVYRADGPHACAFGKALVGETLGTRFTDSGLQNGRAYHYVVAGFPASDACMGPASACLTVTPGPLFADGFESGDTSAWSNTVP